MATCAVELPVPNLMSERIYRVLVVEDHSADARLIREAFGDCGYLCRLQVMDSSVAAEQLLATECFDLLVSDFGTDTERATKFLRSVRSLAPLLPIVVLSGTIDPNPAYRAGANVFVKKSDNMTEFFAKIQAIMHFWIDVAELPSRADDVCGCSADDRQSKEEFV